MIFFRGFVFFISNSICKHQNKYLILKKIITKFIVNTITKEELELLYQWLEESKNQDEFEKYVLDYHDLNLATLKNDVDKAYGNVKKTIETKKNTTKVIRLFHLKNLKYVAVLILLIATGYFLTITNNESHTTPEIVFDNNISIGINKATLTLEDGSTVALERGKEYKNDKVSSDGKKIVYQSEIDTLSEKLVYNYLTIPRGGEFYLELADGTKVWLNSDSKLKYPIAFKGGAPREVELLYGEAYFDVTPSSDYNGAKFKVLTKGQEVEVLGTEFNIKSYKEEHLILTTLVEGNVKVINEFDTITLIPTQQSVVDIATNSIEVTTVNVHDQVSWKNGIFSFKGCSLEEIMKVMERWYDIEVEIENTSLKETRFIGLFRKDLNIEYILLTIKNSNIINEYEIKNQKVILK